MTHLSILFFFLPPFNALEKPKLSSVFATRKSGYSLYHLMLVYLSHRCTLSLKIRNKMSLLPTHTCTYCICTAHSFVYHTRLTQKEQAASLHSRLIISGCRLSFFPKCVANSYCKSFVPAATELLNTFYMNF